MKKLAISLMGMVFIVGCGGSGDKSKTITEQIQERDVISILYNYPADLCGELQNALKANGYKDPLVASFSTSVSCASLGREIGDSCGESYEGFNTLDSCVGSWNNR